MNAARLESALLRAVVTADRGEIRSLVYRPTESELLFQSPWRPAPSGLDLMEPEAWTRAWPGGWTLLFPNAGERCTVAGREHGFHGAASLARWTLGQVADDALLLGWRDPSGLEVERWVRLREGRLEIQNCVTNRSGTDQPFLLVEHLIFGERIAGPGARIAAPAAPLVRMDDAGEPLGEPEPWPTAEAWDTAPARPFSRFGALDRPGDGRVVVERDGLQVAVDWSGLPALWFWHEHQASDGFPDARPITCLGLEPASTKTSQGLARELQGGEACVLRPGASASTLTRVIVQSV